MVKGSMKGNGGAENAKASKPNVNKPQSGDARKEKNINEIVDDVALSWSSNEELSESSIDHTVSVQDQNVFLANRNQVASWIDSVRTSVRITSAVNPSPHPIQLLASNIGNSSIPVNWRNSLFHNIVKEGLNLEKPVEQSVVNLFGDVVTITIEDVQSELYYWKTTVVCYIWGVKPPFRIINGFIRRIWRNSRIVKVAMLENDMFMVRFRTVDSKNLAINAGPILYDDKPVIVKE